MAKGEVKIQARRPDADDLEPYRRLIEIQRQLVEMSKQHELARRECEVLRERVARELMKSQGRGKLVHRLRRSAASLLKRLQFLPAPGSSLQALNHTQPLP